MTQLFINYWRETGDRYCTLFLPFSHLILVMSTSFSCSRHCCTTPPPPDRMQSLASQQIMWRTRVLAENEAMSHKGPLWVPDYDNIRSSRKEEVSAGSWQACEGLRENHTYLSEKPGCHPDSDMIFTENGWYRLFTGCHQNTVYSSLLSYCKILFLSVGLWWCCPAAGPWC